jgi:hypothetical protein
VSGAPPDLQPTNPMAGVPLYRQAARMRELHATADLATRDDLLYRLDNAGSLSRADMALATGLLEAEVGRIIRHRWEHDAELRHRRAEERSTRHSKD